MSRLRNRPGAAATAFGAQSFHDHAEREAYVQHRDEVAAGFPGSAVYDARIARIDRELANLATVALAPKPRPATAPRADADDVHCRDCGHGVPVDGVLCRICRDSDDDTIAALGPHPIEVP